MDGSSHPPPAGFDAFYSTGDPAQIHNGESGIFISSAQGAPFNLFNVDSSLDAIAS